MASRSKASTARCASSTLRCTAATRFRSSSIFDFNAAIFSETSTASWDWAARSSESYEKEEGEKDGVEEEQR